MSFCLDGYIDTKEATLLLRKAFRCARETRGLPCPKSPCTTMEIVSYSQGCSFVKEPISPCKEELSAARERRLIADKWGQH